MAHWQPYSLTARQQLPYLTLTTPTNQTYLLYTDPIRDDAILRLDYPHVPYDHHTRMFRPPDRTKRDLKLLWAPHTWFNKLTGADVNLFRLRSEVCTCARASLRRPQKYTDRYPGEVVEGKEGVVWKDAKFWDWGVRYSDGIEMEGVKVKKGKKKKGVQRQFQVGL
ncbi:hypothetical protein BJ508DRAFT_349612 [Ascobolus immersus RN42]|uniref:Uncharacterized protein n=1 Tax=Ascobolus immersus RN42 TaxID=1160509 RepID=A0A3N4IIK4_ASCIM|nr:hypothetical protein BJ508DRAFT_349612 [Ascobolus immersus RN42]